MISKFVFANLKMNLNKEQINNYINVLDSNFFISNIVLFPTSIYIPYFINKNFEVGIQNVFYEDSGSYTGEVSPKQASNLGVSYVLVGHSDRRKIGEDDLVINKKIKKSLENGLSVILCVGETSTDRDMLRTNKVLKQQIIRGLNDVNKKYQGKIFIAYEPVWSIGTNVVPSNVEIFDSIEYIKKICSDNLGYIPFVLYGGSVNKKNIRRINTVKNLDGFLIGSSSNDVENLIDIINIIEE